MLVAQLLDSVSKKKSVRPFLQLTAEKRLAARAALSPMQSRRFFESVQALLEHVVEKLAYKGPNAGVTQSFLSAIATLLQQEEKPGEAAYQVALSLSQLLYEVDDKTQKAILDLVSTWWIQEARHRETLVPRALLLWTEQAVQAASKTQILGTLKQLYSVREAFQCIDWSQESSRELQQWILQLVARVRLPAGRKLVAYLLQSDGDLMRILHASIKQHVPHAPPSVLTALGQVYYQAWKEATLTQSTLELDVLEELVYASVHNERLHKKLLTFLQPFTEAKDTRDLLHQLYTPFLWRALTVPHATVRLQACRILPYVFPLQGPNELTKVAMDRACQALLQLLDDANPGVRVAACQASTQVLGVYWDAVPSDWIRMLLLDQMVTRHASDSMSASVRAAAVGGVTTLLTLEAPRAVLRSILPRLGNLIHDTAESVRHAVVRLLLQVKQVPTIKYFHVVPPHHLVARLEVETSSSVITSLVRLVANSYFCENVDERHRRARLIMEESPSAARALFGNCANCVPSTKMAELAVALWDTKDELCANDTGKRVRQESKQEDSDDEEEGIDISRVQHTCEIIEALLGSMDMDGVEDFLQDNLDVLPALRQYPSLEPVLLQIAGHLPVNDEMVEYVSSKLEISEHVALLLAWQVPVLPTLAQAIETGLRGGGPGILFQSPVAKSKKRKGKAPVQPTVEASTAVTMLQELLAKPATRTPVLECAQVERALEQGIQATEVALRNDEDSDEEFLLAVCECYARFLLHQQARPNLVDLAPRVEESLIGWVNRHVLPLLETQEQNEKETTLTEVRNALLTPTGPSRRRTNRNGTPAQFGGGKQQSKLARALLVMVIDFWSRWIAACGVGADRVDQACLAWNAVVDTTALVIALGQRGATASLRAVLEQEDAALETILLGVLKNEAAAQVVSDMLSQNDSLQHALNQVAPRRLAARQLLETTKEQALVESVA